MGRLTFRLSAFSLAFVVAGVAGCGKPGDQAGGTAHERSQASQQNTPSPSIPEPNPQPDALRSPPPGAASAASGG